MKILSLFRAFDMIAILTLTACVTTAHDPATPAPSAFSSIDGRYAALLGEEYRMAANLFNANGYSDAIARFQAKAAEAQSGQWVYPDSPAEGESRQAQAYDELNGALMFIMDEKNAPWMAKAQVNYDCWINIPSEDGCRRNFSKAMSSLAPSDDLVKKEVVYFETDSSEITPDARSALEALARQVRMSKYILIRLTGFRFLTAQHRIGV